MGKINPSVARAEAQLPVLMNVCGQPASHARHRIVVQPHVPLSRKRHPLQAGAKGVMRQPMACLYLGDRVGVGNRLAFRNEGARSNALSNAL